MTVVNLDVTQHRDPTDPWIDSLEEVVDWLAPVSQVLQDDIAERFATRTDPWGGAWDPPSPVTINLRIKGGRVGEGWGATTGFDIREGGRRVVVFASGGNAWKARFVQWGAPDSKLFGRAFAPIPPRAFLPIRGPRGNRVASFPDALRAAVMASAIRALRLKVEALLRSLG